MTHDEVTRHGANIIDLLEKYSKDNGILFYDVILIYMQVLKLMKKIAEEEMKKRDS